jgi:predicted permease
MYHALRSLARSPGFTITALITLALGIGVNTTMFSVLRTIVVRTLRYPESDRLVHLFRTAREANILPHSPGYFLDLHAQNTVFERIAAFEWTRFNLAEPGMPAEQLSGMKVTADFFPLLGMSPTLGLGFTAEDDEPGNNQVVVLSHRFWSSRFAGDPGLVGREIRLNGEPVTVLGVMPPAFDDPLLWGRIDAWRPLAFSPQQRANRTNNYLRVIARLKPGVSADQAETVMNGLWDQLVARDESYAKNSLRLTPLSRGSQVDNGPISWFVMALAALVLLIACANLANLQFARTAARAREHAVRAALGASRATLMRGVLAESLLLALGGGALGVLVALWCNDLLGRRFNLDSQSGLEIPLDVGVLAFAMLVSTATGIAFGLLPAWLAARTNVNDALKQGGRGMTASRAQHRIRHALTIAGVALALMLLSTASLFARGLQRISQRDPGWRMDGLLSAYLSIQTPKTADTPDKRTAYRLALVEQLQQQLAALPGVEHVAFATQLPIWGFNTEGVVVDGRPRPEAGAIAGAAFASVTPDYFATLGLRLRAGRSFTQDDRADTPAVVVINETMARTLWPGESPIGKRIGNADANPRWREVVGIASDAHRGATLGIDDAGFQVYRPLAQNPATVLELALRARVAPQTLAPEIRRIVAQLNPDQPIHQIGMVRDEVELAFNNIRLASLMLAGFAVLGLLLAAIGIYAVIANAVVQRTNEIGIRMALGAQVRDILELVIGQGIRLAVIGTMLGLAGAFAIARTLTSIAPALAEIDAVIITGVVALIIGVATFACWLPARRAAKVDPMTALRAE